MGVREMVAEARSRVAELSPDELRRELDREGTLLVDVRDVRERERDGSIPGARHVPRGMLEFWADPESGYHRSFMDPDARVVLFCNLGQRSALAADTLQRLGYRNVAHLAAGFDGWQKAGGTIEAIEKR